MRLSSKSIRGSTKRGSCVFFRQPVVVFVYIKTFWRFQLSRVEDNSSGFCLAKDTVLKELDLAMCLNSFSEFDLELLYNFTNNTIKFIYFTYLYFNYSRISI